ncbi:MAG: hypothetical protein VYB40_06190 [Candidatus Thermoplasmatota archaeon]|nr:hypothetical protein [Candidatus Thermoplasmatota archaeon]
MRSCVLVAVLLLFTFTAPSICGEELVSTSSTPNTLLDWEGGSTPVLTYDGLISDPQQMDSIPLGEELGVVHLIELENSEHPLKVTIKDEMGIIMENTGNNLTFLISGTNQSTWVEITSVEFSAPNAYRVLVHSNSGDDYLELHDLWGGGYIHEDDSEGDRIFFTVGASVNMQLEWNLSENVEIVGYRTHTGSGEVVELNFTNEQALTIQTPEATSRFDEYEFNIWVRTNGSTGTWEIKRTVMNQGDSACAHDCPRFLDPTGFPVEALTLANQSLVIEGHLDQNDTADVYAIHIPEASWSIHRLIASSDSEDVKMQIQYWNNSGEQLSLIDVEDGKGTIGINVTGGYHLIRLEQDSMEQTTPYLITLQSINLTTEEDLPLSEIEFIDRWKEFTPFYIGIGILMLLPMGYVVWSLRSTRIASEVQIHERKRLVRLRKRLTQLVLEDASDQDISSALEMLEQVHWRAIEAEMGSAALSHHTESVTLKVWRIDGDSLIVGIHVEDIKWELAALRFEAIEGPSWNITQVTPKALFDGDEIFLDTLEAGATRFIQLCLEGDAELLDLHLSGLVDGKPLAAVPAKALLMENKS